MSEAAIEDEWLLGPGAEFVIGEIKPEVMSNRSKERKLDTKEEKDVEKYLQTKDDQLSKNLVYKINMYKQPVPQTEFKLKLQEGCKELGISFEYESVKDITIDDVVNQLLKDFDTYKDKLNKLLIN